jgi:transposase
VHFIMDTVRLLDVGQARVNERGTGSPQDPPTRMLGLLIYSYATGTFISHQSELAPYENVAVRLPCADRHPDHESICTFRRTNGALLKSSFEQVLAFAGVRLCPLPTLRPPPGSSFSSRRPAPGAPRIPWRFVGLFRRH